MTTYRDQWHPLGAHDADAQVGNYIAAHHAVWRIVRIDEIPPELWTSTETAAVEGVRAPYAAKAAPCQIVVCPWNADPDDRDQHKAFRIGGGTWWGRYRRLPTYPGGAHFPACPTCHEPFPCRDQHGARIAGTHLARMARYETAGVCPSCQEPVTARQKSMTWEDNIEVIAGPPVTFHAGRASCRYAAAQYEKKWVAADPNRRKATLSCPGTVTNHGNRMYHCTEGVDCPGPAAEHRAYTTCGDPEHWPDPARRPQCHPDRDARRIDEVGERGGPHYSGN